MPATKKNGSYAVEMICTAEIVPSATCIPDIVSKVLNAHIMTTANTPNVL